MSSDQELDTRLEAMFVAQSRALRVPDREWTDVVDRRAPAPSWRRRSSATLAVAAFAAVLVVVAVALRIGPDEEVRTDGTAAPATTSAALPVTPPFKVETKQVSLTAQALLIDVGGRSFAAPPPLEVGGDPGMVNEYTTLELSWREHGVEMRLNIYFKSDGREWWSDEIRTYDGRTQGEWIYHTGDFFRSKLGTPFVGDFDSTGREDEGAGKMKGRLRLPGLRLEAFRRPAACATPTSPYALEPDVNQVIIPGDASGYGLAVKLFDTAACLPVGRPGNYDYRWVTEGPNIVKHSTGEDRADLQPIGVGTTTLRVTAVDKASSQVVGETSITVTVAAGGPSSAVPTPQASPPASPTATTP